MSDQVDTVAMPVVPVGSWRWALGTLAAGFALFVGVYHHTWLSLLDIWWRSQTFTHGFLIIPISLWLIGREWPWLVRLSPAPDYRALLALGILGLGWLMARVAEVLVVEQLAMIAMIPMLVWLLLGGQIARRMWFPLGFLVFAVPMGEPLIPILIDFTADFTVGMLRLTGIPVFREGAFFSIPSGDWSVVEACSGLRYLIASLTLGCLYAYLNYRSPLKRLIFFGLSAVVPIIANGFRAYMIVMIGHLSNMRLAVGVDHLIYGWVFFGLVMLLLFWVGSWWSEPDPPLVADSTDGEAVSPISERAFALGLVAGLAVIAIWPVRAAQIERQALAQVAPWRLHLPDEAGAWHAASDLTAWAPAYLPPDAQFSRTYRQGEAAVQVFLLYYRYQTQEAELVNSSNVLVAPGHHPWRMIEERGVEARLQGQPTTVLQGYIRSARQDLVTWRWNRIGGEDTASSYYGKWLEVKDKLLGRGGSGLGMVIATDSSPEQAGKVLQDFLDAFLPALAPRIEQAAGG